MTSRLDRSPVRGCLIIRRGASYNMTSTSAIAKPCFTIAVGLILRYIKLLLARRCVYTVDPTRESREGELKSWHTALAKPLPRRLHGIF